MDLEKLYYEIKNYIEIVDFSKLWRGFEPLKFALYTDSECFFDGMYIEKTDLFLGNTAILYNGEWIAIWNVQEEMNPIVLTSKMIHEMFHGFQMMNHDGRFPDELDALYNYKYEEGNLNLKLMENQLLCHLSTRFDKEMFEEFLKIRKYLCNFIHGICRRTITDCPKILLKKQNKMKFMQSAKSDLINSSPTWNARLKYLPVN